MISNPQDSSQMSPIFLSNTPMPYGSNLTFFFDCRGDDDVGGVKPNCNRIGPLYSSSRVKILFRWSTRNFPSVTRSRAARRVGSINSRHESSLFLWNFVTFPQLSLVLPLPRFWRMVVVSVVASILIVAIIRLGISLGQHVLVAALDWSRLSISDLSMSCVTRDVHGC